jgi:iron complex outermembrane recepter protein
MRKACLLVTACILTLAGLAQTGSISGTVQDNSKKSVIGASASLLKAVDSSVIKTALTDKDGKFTFSEIDHGKYLVAVTVSGFRKAVSGEITVKNESPAQELGVISLTVEAKSLETVTVTSKKPFIEQKMDKTIVNVDAAVTNAGSSILEVLEKSPGITIDKDGNISLKGKLQVLVLIDGRPTYLGQTELASLLKSMPASNADQIEIMTDPSAKYDAAGNSGIINIKTKKNKQQGFNGSINLNYSQGRYWKTNNNFNLNYRKGKFNFFANGGYSKWNGFQNLDINRKFSAPGSIPGSIKDYTAIFDQETKMRNQSDNYMMKMGVDYYLSKKTTLGIITTGLINPETFKSKNTSYLQDGQSNVDSIVYAVSDNKNRWNNKTINLNLRHQFDSTGKEFSTDLDYASYSSTSSMHFQNTTYDPEWILLNQNHTAGRYAGAD